MSRDPGNLRELIGHLAGDVVIEARVSNLGVNWLNIATGGALIWTNTEFLLADSNNFLLASEDPVDRIAEVITTLDGRRVTAVEVSHFLDLTLDFEGLRLTTFTTSALADTRHWSIQFSSGFTVFAGPGADWSVERTG